MKINVTIPSFYPATVYGGTIFSSLYTCEELAKRNHEVFVSTTNTNLNGKLQVPKNQWIRIRNFWVKYYDETIVNRFSLSLFCGLWKDIQKAEVVHIQAIFNSPTPIALFYSALLKKPILLSPRGVMGHWIMNHGIPFKRLWLKICISPFAKNICWHATSDQEKQEILKWFPSAKIFTIPNGINSDEFGEPHIHLSKIEYMKRFTNSAQNPSHILVSMGRIHKKKGFDILIHSFFQLKELFPEAVLLIAGEDEGEKNNLIEIVNSSFHGKDVFFIPFVSGKEKIDFLTYADVFALPSHNENFGNVYLESLACGTPICASKHTPWQEVEEFSCGKWVENTPDQFTTAISELFKQDRQQLATKATTYARSFQWPQIAEKFESTFEELIRLKSKLPN